MNIAAQLYGVINDLRALIDVIETEGETAPDGEPVVHMPRESPTPVDDKTKTLVVGCLNERRTLGELVKATGLDVDAVRSAIKALRAEGLVRTEGQRRGTRYVNVQAGG